MNILSLFDWISCARVALDRAGIKVDKYFASEIDKYAIQVAKKNYPDTVGVWDVKAITYKWLLERHISYIESNELIYYWPIDIDLMIWWSPCQDLSIAKKDRKGLDGEKSGLFREYIRILHEVKPKWFILENVASMSQESKDIITRELWVEPIMIDAALVSAQDRKRLFRTNIPWITQPKDKWIILKDIIKWDREKVDISVPLIKTKRGYKWDISGKGYFSQQDRAYSRLWKFPTIPTARTVTKMKFVDDHDNIRQMIFEDIEELQWLPRGYTALLSQKEKRGWVIWNAFNADVITHILSFIPIE